MESEREKKQRGMREDGSQAFQAILELTSDIVLLLDAQKRVRGSSRRAQVAFGLPPDDLSGPTLFQLLAEEKDGPVLETLLIDSGLERSRHQRIDFKQPGGGVLRLEVHMKPMEDEGRRKGWILFVGKHLDPSKEGLGDASRYATLLDRMLRGYSEPILVIDPPSRTIKECNQAAVSALGYSKEELQSRTIDSLGEDGSFSGEPERLRRFAYSTTGIFHSRTRLRRKDRAILTFAYTNVALFDGRGRMESLMCILHDKTESDAREAQLLNMAEDVELFSRHFKSLTEGLSNSAREPARLSDRGLTLRQIEIVRLVVAGNPTKLIAKDLNLAEATIKGHLAQIFRTLEVTNRIDLLRLIHEKGLRIE